MAGRWKVCLDKFFFCLESLFVFACVHNVHVLRVGAVDENGRKPFYAEKCASMLAVTFSSGDGPLRSIVSVSLPQPEPSSTRIGVPVSAAGQKM